MFSYHEAVKQDTDDGLRDNICYHSLPWVDMFM